MSRWLAPLFQPVKNKLLANQRDQQESRPALLQRGFLAFWPWHVLMPVSNFATVCVADILAFDHENDHLGDIGGMVGYPLQVF